MSNPVCPSFLVIHQISCNSSITSDELCKYYEDTWLNGSFPIASWNHYATEGPRTNNHVEGWHKKLNVAAGKTHPNVFEIVEVFQQEQAMTEVTLQQLAGWSNPKEEQILQSQGQMPQRE